MTLLCFSLDVLVIYILFHICPVRPQWKVFAGSQTIMNRNLNYIHTVLNDALLFSDGVPERCELLSPGICVSFHYQFVFSFQRLSCAICGI